MKRFFGSNKPRERATLDGAITMVDKQGGHIEARIDKLNAELSTLNTQMKNATTQTAKNVIKNKALRLLKQRKQYESQLDRVRQQSFNMDNMNFAVHSMENAVIMSDAIQTGTKAIKQNMRKVNLDKIESVTDDMKDLMEEANEINFLLGENFDEEAYNEEDLMAEFEDLEVMCADEGKTGKLLDDIGINPNLADISTLPSSISTDPLQQQSSSTKQPTSSKKPVMLNSSGSKTNSGLKVDEFGLPIE